MRTPPGARVVRRGRRIGRQKALLLGISLSAALFVAWLSALAPRLRLRWRMAHGQARAVELLEVRPSELVLRGEEGVGSLPRRAVAVVGQPYPGPGDWTLVTEGSSEARSDIYRGSGLVLEPGRWAILAEGNAEGAHHRAATHLHQWMLVGLSVATVLSVTWLALG